MRHIDLQQVLSSSIKTASNEVSELRVADKLCLCSCVFMFVCVGEGGEGGRGGKRGGGEGGEEGREEGGEGENGE